MIGERKKLKVFWGEAEMWHTNLIFFIEIKK